MLFQYLDLVEPKPSIVMVKNELLFNENDIGKRTIKSSPNFLLASGKIRSKKDLRHKDGSLKIPQKLIDDLLKKNNSPRCSASYGYAFVRKVSFSRTKSGIFSYWYSEYSQTFLVSAYKKYDCSVLYTWTATIPKRQVTWHRGKNDILGAKDYISYKKRRYKNEAEFNSFLNTIQSPVYGWQRVS